MSVWLKLGRMLWDQSCIEARVSFGVALFRLLAPNWLPGMLIQLAVCAWCMYRLRWHYERFQDLMKARAVADALTDRPRPETVRLFP